MKTVAQNHALLKSLSKSHAFKQDLKIDVMYGWANEKKHPRNIHRRVNSDLVFACVSLLVLLLFAAADATFRF